MNRIIHFLRASRMVVILLHATLLTATAAQTADLSRGAGGPPTEKRRLCLGERAAFYGRANGSVRFTAGAKNIHSERYEPVFTPSRPFVKACGIEKQISYHCGRHSFATIPGKLT